MKVHTIKVSQGVMDRMNIHQGTDFVGQCRICDTHVMIEEAAPSVWFDNRVDGTSTEIDGPICVNCLEEYTHDSEDVEITLNGIQTPGMKSILAKLGLA